ncbi:hypothetical protein [Nostoc sp. TCL26-01]|uniref:hypothetical protein n=1 Tax=Nostoc sp. TCL26-01 TaxID=2576904 RepID=UPI0015BECD10|nr:hypothetical protein [Nostoc sp. TCL26-01]QLE56333.1 hypothetical protein FD725_12780 [Nostoc sp. TCL26-01]
MVRITISDLDPSNEEQFITELTAGEMRTVQAGMRRRGSRGVTTSEETEALPSDEEIGVSFDEINSTLDDWMARLDLQLADLRKQLGI